MNIKRCEGCRSMYSPGASGGASILCRKCHMDSESHYATIYRFIRENPGASIEEIAEGSGVDKFHIKALILDGRFGSNVQGADALLEAQRKRQLLNMMQSGEKPATPAGGGAATTPAKKPSSSNKSYGLGR